MASKDQGESATQLGIDAVVDVLGPRLQTENDDAPHAAGDDLALSESAQDAPRPDSRPVSGMDWLERHVGGRRSLHVPPDFDLDAKPQDTSAYGRRTDRPDPGSVIPPRSHGGPGSNLDPLLSIPVITVDTAPRPAETPPPLPEVQRPIPRVMVLSSPTDRQVCPECKGPLRVIRSTRENRLECTWFRLEWLEIERGFGDCKQHLQVETTRLARPAFLLPKGPVGNGLLARILTWRWQDHMPGHQIMRLLDGLGIHCTQTRVARWLQAAAAVVAPVAAAIRQASSGGKTDAQGLVVVDGGEEGRLRATVKGSLISYDWTPGDATPRPDDPKERARDVLLDARGWSRAGAQAHLRRLVARALATDRDHAARLSWRLEQLRTATDYDAELAAMETVIQSLDDPDLVDPHLKSAHRDLAAGGAQRIYRFADGTRLAEPPPLPQNAHPVLPAWFLSSGDGGHQQVADCLSLTQSCTASGVSSWRLLRDLFEASAQPDGPPINGQDWIPGHPR